MTLDDLVGAIAALPGAEVGRGFEHPVDPDPGYADYFRELIEHYPSLKDYPDYLEFLRRYSGCVVDYHEPPPEEPYWSSDLYGIGPWEMKEAGIPVDADGFFVFSNVMKGVRRRGKSTLPRPPDVYASFAFDTTGERKKVVHALVRREDEPVPPYREYCSDFTEWLRRFTEAGGRLLPFHEEAESVGKP